MSQVELVLVFSNAGLILLLFSSGLALWLVCIIERGAINNPDNESYFNIFAILFELVSAYGTVGLSLGVSYVRRLSPLPPSLFLIPLTLLPSPLS